MSSMSILDDKGTGYFEELEDKTIEYVKDITMLMASPLGKTATGSMRAPSASSGAQVYVQEGSGTVKVSSTLATTSAVVVYDPEISLRRGRAAVTIYERNAAGEVVNVSTVNIGRTSSDFVSGGVISSTLAVKNTSASDEIAGTQTQAVLYSIPKSIDGLSATDLLQFATNKSHHLVSNINSKEDHTITNSYTEHTGGKQALLRDSARSNLATAKFATSATNSSTQGFGAFGTVTGTGFLDDGDRAAGVKAILGDKPTLADAIYDSGKDASFNPFSLESYGGRIACQLSLLSSAIGATSGDITQVTFAACALDASGKVLAVTDVPTTPFAGVNDAIAANTKFDVSFEATLTSTSVPVARVALFLKSALITGGANVDIMRGTDVSSVTIEAFTENADVSERGVHFCVLEGLNTAAAVNIHAANVLSGVPDSKNAFISSGAKSNVILNYAIITNMLVTFRTMMPLAYTGFGRDAAAATLAKYYELEGMKIKLQAMSFGDISKALGTIGQFARDARKTGSKIADVVDPALKIGGAALASGMLGPTGQMAGAGMLTGSMAIDRARRSGLLE